MFAQDPNTGVDVETEGTFTTALEYSCPVPETTTHRRRRSVTTRTTALSLSKVSITIDGVLYSNALDFVLFDSVCMECNSSDTCRQKVAFVLSFKRIHNYSDVYYQQWCYLCCEQNVATGRRWEVVCRRY